MKTQTFEVEYIVLNGLIMSYRYAFPICSRYMLDEHCFTTVGTRWLYNTIMSIGRESGTVTPESVEAQCFCANIKQSEALACYVDSTKEPNIVIGDGYHSSVVSLTSMRNRKFERLIYLPFRSICDNSNDEELEKAKEISERRKNEYLKYKKTDIDVSGVIDSIMEEIESPNDEEQNKCPMDWISTFDNDFVKIKPYEFIVLAARPGGGKTAMILNILNHCILNNRRVFLGTFEMSIREIIELIAGQNARVNVNRIHSETTRSIENYKIELAKIKELYFDGKIGFSSNHIVNGFMDELTQFSMIHGKPDVVFVDYIQLMRGNNDFNSEDKKHIDLASVTLKRYTRDTNIPVIAAAQLNRDHSKEGVEPQLHDLKGSGNLEQDANRVWLLHTPKVNSEGTEQFGQWLTEVNLYQAKARGAPKAKKNLLLNGPQRRFYEPLKKND